MQYFGERYPTDSWPAPIYEGLEKVETPVGEICWYCSELIVEGDRGFIQSSYIHRDDKGAIIHTRDPVHHECNMRQTVGSYKHLRKECGCFTGKFSGDDDAGFPSKREAAKAAVAEFERQYATGEFDAK